MRASSWDQYSEAGSELDELDGRGPWRDSAAGYAASGVTTAARQLREAREAQNAEELVQLLRTMMVRNHLQIDRPSLHTECRVGTKHSIEEFVHEQVAALRWLAESASQDAARPASSRQASSEEAEASEGGPACAGALSLDAAIEFFERSIVCLGHTALCLSGGGSLAMHRAHAEAEPKGRTKQRDGEAVLSPLSLSRASSLARPLSLSRSLALPLSLSLSLSRVCVSLPLRERRARAQPPDVSSALPAVADMGVVKALIENHAMPMIVTGTSGGAIVCAMLATHTDAEMLSKVIQPDVAVRYPERWFPPMEQQLYNYLKSGCLVEHDDFANCCRAYFGDMTFVEAYEHTGRIANINISVGSRQGGVGKRGALLLNYLTAPYVLIRSALHASCALPTVMHPTTLLMKNASGEIVPFEKESLEFIDGSFTADIPRRRLSELFHVTQVLRERLRATASDCERLRARLPAIASE